MKKIMSIATVFVIALHLAAMTAVAEDETLKLPENAKHIIEVNQMGTIEEYHKLYNAHETEIGVCLDFDDAYLIYLSNGVVTEFSCEDNSEYYGTDDIAFYGGPLAYYKQIDNSYVDLLSDKVILKDNFEKQTVSISELQNENVEKIQNLSPNDELSVYSTIPDGDEVVYLPYSLKSYVKKNTQGTCGAVATAIMLYYYYDHVSSNYIQNSFFVNNTEAFHDFLVSKYFVKRSDGTYGQTNSELVDRTNLYFKNYNINNSASYKSYSDRLPYSAIYNSITMKERPIIIRLYENAESISEWSINHFVVAHGYTDPSIYGQYHYAFYYVNDGWGHNNRAIFDSSAYIMGTIGYNK